MDDLETKAGGIPEKKRGRLASWILGPKEGNEAGFILPPAPMNEEGKTLPVAYQPPKEEKPVQQNAQQDNPKNKEEDKDIGEYQKLFDHLKEKFYKINCLEKENAELMKNYAEKQKTVESLEKDLVERAQQIESAKVAYSKQESDFNATRIKLGKFECALNEANRRIVEYDKAEEAHANATQSYKAKMSEYEKIKMSLEGLITTSKNEYLQKEMELKEAVDAGKRQNEDYLKQISTYQQQIADYNNLLDQSKAAQHELEIKLNRTEDMHKQIAGLLLDKK